jgi:outer membrane protein
LALKDFFPSGTTLEVGAATSITDSSLYQDPFAATRLGLTVTQALLRGFGSSVNTAKLRQSQLAVDISVYELRGFCETLISQVESAYWDYALAQREIEILEESLRLARQQLADTQEMIEVGSMAETELVAVQAQVALQQQGLINARSQLAHARLQLLRLLNPPGQPFWDLQVELIHPPSVPQVQLEAVSEHEEVARRMRPELKQAELEVEQQTIELVRTRNGVLPQMDFFVTLGKSGYAESFGQSVQDLDGDSYDVAAGFEFQFPLANHAAKAQHKRARLRQDQKAKALLNLTQLVELDVRRAYIEVSRTKAQIKASTATRKFEAEKLRVETVRFRVGRATSLTVAQAQQDLLVARIGEVRAVVDYLKALTDFYRLEGSLLRHRGIQAPGAEPLPEKGRPPS